MMNDANEKHDVILRPERADEFLAIYELVETAFKTAKVSNGDEQNFVNRLRLSNAYLPALALVAERGRNLIGHVMLTRFPVDLAQGMASLLLLAPLAVKRSERHKGLGSTLVREAIKQGESEGYDGIVLVGDPAFYTRFGFKPSVAFGLRNKDAIPDVYVMALELAPGALQGLCGTMSFVEG